MCTKGGKQRSIDAQHQKQNKNCKNIYSREATINCFPMKIQKVNYTKLYCSNKLTSNLYLRPNMFTDIPVKQ